MKTKLGFPIVASLLLSGCATTYSINPVAEGSQSVSYDRGRPTTELDMNNGVVKVTPVQVADNGRLVFSIAAFNKGQSPVNFGVENISMATPDGAPVRVFTHDELVREAKNKARWAAFATALAGGMAAYSANANAYKTTNGTIMGSNGASYNYFARTYDPTAAAIGTTAAAAATGTSIYAIRRNLNDTLENLGDKILQTTTLTPGNAFAGQVIAAKLKAAPYPREILLTVNWNGDAYPFRFRIEKAR